MIGGFSGFGLAYVITATAFLSAESEALVTGKDDSRGCGRSCRWSGRGSSRPRPTSAGRWAVLGVMQVGALATGIAGASIRARNQRDAETRVLRDVSLAPWHAGSTTGLILRGRF